METAREKVVWKRITTVICSPSSIKFEVWVWSVSTFWVSKSTTSFFGSSFSNNKSGQVEQQTCFFFGSPFCSNNKSEVIPVVVVVSAFIVVVASSSHSIKWVTTVVVVRDQINKFSTHATWNNNSHVNCCCCWTKLNLVVFECNFWSGKKFKP